MTSRRQSSHNQGRGNSADRRARKLWLLTTYGDGELTTCYLCAVPLLFDDLTVDRIKPGVRGGSYARVNIRPACGFCNSSTGSKLGHEIRAEKLQNPEGMM